MIRPLTRPTLVVYRRPGCHLCDEAEVMLQAALEERASRGLVTPLVERRDVSADPGLEARYGARLPVFEVGEDEVDLVTTGRQVRALLERTMPLLA